LKSLASLQTLSLTFEQCDQINDQGVKNLSEILKKLVSLENLFLSFFGCENVGKQTLENEIQKIKEYLPNCEVLTISL